MAPRSIPMRFGPSIRPPAMCGGGVTPPTPTGTPECPGDKNREGCPCPASGAKAACWPGLRKNRNRGICHDGTTTCNRIHEVELLWGPCEGYELPDPDAGMGKRACQCFSSGQWKLPNVSPCFWGDGGADGATSTVIGDGGKAACPPDAPPALPSGSWTSDTLRVDCAGHFRLCFTLKAGDRNNPQPGDCVVAQVCTEGDYTTANVEQTFPDLPSWSSHDTDCTKAFSTTGGYGEMSVNGTSIECDDIPDHVFNRVGYCPTSCNDDPTGPGCAGCMQGGSGGF